MNSQDRKSFIIDCFPENVKNYKHDFTIVAVDVIRATTTAITAVAMGRRCYVAGELDNALVLAATLDDPLLVGEIGGDMPPGFHLPNSPARVAQENNLVRPMVLLSTSGTKVMAAAKGAQCFAACLRNYTAQAIHLIRHHPHVALVGAGTRGEFREEDQLCCAWIAEILCRLGAYAPLNEQTASMVDRWHHTPVESLLVSNSVAYLRRSGQLHDLDFIMSHIDDLPSVFPLHGDELVRHSETYETGDNGVAVLGSKPSGPELNANV